MKSDPHQGSLAGSRWDPGRYARFSDHRLRPALELLDRVPEMTPALVCDLGCGAGAVSRIMRERWPDAEIVGIDNSRDMLDKAAAGGTGIRWVEAPVETWQPEAPPDLIYSNAALHWVADHGRHFPRLLSCLRPGGCLAVQMPLSWGEPSHRLMRETLADGGAGGKAIGTQTLRDAVARKWVEDPAYYYDLLSAGSARLDIWKTEYLQLLDGDDPVFEWVSATGLRPVLNTLEGDELTQFVRDYKRRLREAYPRRPDGKTLYPFPRLFIVAVSR